MTHAATQKEIEKAMELASKATQGPWENVHAAYEDCLVCKVDSILCCINRDVDFIAASRELVPAMAERILLLVEALETVMKTFDEAHPEADYFKVAWSMCAQAHNALADYRGTKEGE